MGALDNLADMLRTARTVLRSFPATELYNEGWLLRLTLDWFSRQTHGTHALCFATGSRWFSEGILPTQFSSRGPGPTSLAEGRTHADGIVGHFTVGGQDTADISVDENASQMLIIEAKMFSPLAQKVTNAGYFDQAARNVACLAEMLQRAGIKPDHFDSLGFVVLAPDEQITAGVFAGDMTRESIGAKVQRRVKEYDHPEKRQWLYEWFWPLLDNGQVQCLSWEGVIEYMRSMDSQFGDEISDFYDLCLQFNRQFRGGSE